MSRFDLNTEAPDLSTGKRACLRRWQKIEGTARNLLHILNEELADENELSAPWGRERRELRKALNGE